MPAGLAHRPVSPSSVAHRPALYLYATGEPRVASFDEQMLAAGFRVKSGDFLSG